MTETKRLSVRRRRLSEELRRLRLDAGLTMEAAAEAVEFSVGKVSNIETGVRVRPYVVEVKGLLDAYGVTDERKRESLLALTRQATKKGWWSKYTEVFTDDYPALEADAATISTYQPMLIPGLLQSPGYVELVVRSANLMRDPVDIRHVVDARKRRQDILNFDGGPKLWAVIDAGAIERLKASPEVLHEQVTHLIEMADADNHVTVQVVPFGAGLHAGMKGQFVIMDFAAADSVVYLEMDQDGLFLEESEEVNRYRILFNHLVNAALDADSTIQCLRDAVRS